MRYWNVTVPEQHRETKTKLLNGECSNYKLEESQLVRTEKSNQAQKVMHEQ